MTTETPTNPAESEQEPVTAEVGTEDQALNAAQSDPEAEPGDEPQAQPEDDTEEVEWEGQKHRIPKALKPALLMQADYTRKTQELAEQRRQAEAQIVERQRALALEAQANEHLVGEQAKLVALDQQLQQYAGVNWAQAMATDPAAAQAAWMTWQQLKEQRAGVEQGIAQARNQRIAQVQQLQQQRIAEGLQKLAQDIPNWSDELVGKLRNAGRDDFGFSDAELSQITDPRAVRLLHDAYQYRQILKSAGAKPAASASKPVAAAKPQPVPAQSLPSGGPGNVRTLSDPGLSVDEWMKRREAQLRKRKA